MTGDISLGLSGTSKGEVTLKGGPLRTVCTGASKLNAKVNNTRIHANCDGASKTTFSATADKVEIDCSGVAVNIDTNASGPVVRVHDFRCADQGCWACVKER